MDESIFAGANLGLERKTVRLAPSDAMWPVVFELIAPELKASLADAAVAIEHVGSTAVPGLPAKPILDIAVGLLAGIEKATVTARLEPLGFIYRGESEDDDGLNLMFGWEDKPRRRVVNLHAITHDGRRWREYITFRDRLRTDPQVLDAYAKHKQDMARLSPNDRDAYVESKGAFVAQVLAGGTNSAAGAYRPSDVGGRGSGGR